MHSAGILENNNTGIKGHPTITEKFPRLNLKSMHETNFSIR